MEVQVVMNNLDKIVFFFWLEKKWVEGSGLILLIKYYYS